MTPRKRAPPPPPKKLNVSTTSSTSVGSDMDWLAKNASDIETLLESTTSEEEKERKKQVHVIRFLIRLIIHLKK